MRFSLGMVAGRAAVVSGPANAVFGNSAESSGQVITFTAVPIGTAAADRYVVVCITARRGSTTLDSVTVTGQACSILINETNGTSASRAAIAITNAPVTSGTTADIVVTHSGSVPGTIVQTYAVTSLISTTPTATTSGTANGTATNLAVQAGGVIIACANTLSNTTHTWSGVTEDDDEFNNVGSANHTGSCASLVSAGGGTIAINSTAATATTPVRVAVALR